MPLWVRQEVQELLHETTAVAGVVQAVEPEDLQAQGIVRCLLLGACPVDHSTLGPRSNSG